MRYKIDQGELQALNPHMNTTRQPAIGDELTLPDNAVESTGRLIRPDDGGLLQAALLNGVSQWTIVRLNGLDSPYQPSFSRPIYVPGTGIIRDLPSGISQLEFSSIPASPGIALGLRGMFTAASSSPINAHLDGLPIITAIAGDRFVGVVGTGAFYPGGEPELVIRVGDSPAWVQPWRFTAREWEYQELTLTGEAAQIDQQARDEERARLRELWTRVTPNPLWLGAFETPIVNYLQVSVNYGARRSYNGGPYLTYHEGVDFSAYAGTPVTAPAAGTVVLAEPLYVRGGAVILDHGLGIYTGFYHLSTINVITGQTVVPGDLLGEVGTTGLSTGNHLHWDLLVNGVWVDAATWQDLDTACWLLEGLGEACLPPENSE